MAWSGGRVAAADMEGNIQHRRMRRRSADMYVFGCTVSDGVDVEWS